MAKKPTGGKEFDELARKLIQVPRQEAEREQKKYERRKAAKKKRKKQ